MTADRVEFDEAMEAALRAVADYKNIPADKIIGSLARELVVVSRALFAVARTLTQQRDTIEALLEACRIALVISVAPSSDTYAADVEKIRAAIAKATGAP